MLVKMFSSLYLHVYLYLINMFTFFIPLLFTVHATPNNKHLWDGFTQRKTYFGLPHPIFHSQPDMENVVFLPRSNQRVHEIWQYLLARKGYKVTIYTSHYTFYGCCSLYLLVKLFIRLWKLISVEIICYWIQIFNNLKNFL